MITDNISSESETNKESDGNKIIRNHENSLSEEEENNFSQNQVRNESLESLPDIVISQNETNNIVTEKRVKLTHDIKMQHDYELEYEPENEDNINSNNNDDDEQEEEEEEIRNYFVSDSDSDSGSFSLYNREKRNSVLLSREETQTEVNAQEENSEYSDALASEDENEKEETKVKQNNISLITLKESDIKKAKKEIMMKMMSEIDEKAVSLIKTCDHPLFLIHNGVIDALYSVEVGIGIKLWGEGDDVIDESTAESFMSIDIETHQLIEQEVDDITDDIDAISH